MPTSKPRYQIIFDPEVASIIQSMAKQQHKSISRITQELVKKAIEYDDDAYLCKLVEEIEKESKGMKPIPADEVWKRLGLE